MLIQLVPLRMSAVLRTWIISRSAPFKLLHCVTTAIRVAIRTPDLLLGLLNLASAAIGALRVKTSWMDQFDERDRGILQKLPIIVHIIDAKFTMHEQVAQKLLE